LKRFWILGAVLLVIAAAFVVGAFLEAPPAKKKPTKKTSNPEIYIETSMGDMQVELDPDKAPITVKNFLQYVDEQFYDNTIFHRIVPGFVDQGGGFAPGSRTEKPTHAPIKNEADNGLSNTRGTVAMARTPDPDSATSQFYINVSERNSLQLDKAFEPKGVGYCVFGKVIEGMDVADKINQVRTGPDERPLQDVIIKSIRRVEGESPAPAATKESRS
jgi:cyclophilin family peptidyl-prolyl cis-trans isomerase